MPPAWIRYLVVFALGIVVGASLAHYFG